MRAIFRFRNGYKKEEQWEDNKEIPPRWAIAKPVRVEMDPDAWKRNRVMEPEILRYEFYFTRAYIDENEVQTVIYDCMEQI